MPIEKTVFKAMKFDRLEMAYLDISIKSGLENKPWKVSRG